VQSPTNSPRRPPSRWWWVVAALVVAGTLYGRALLEARGALGEGDRLAARDVGAALVHWRHAVEWHAPGNPWSAGAVQRLWDVAVAPAHTPAEAALALRALESLRTGILLTRSVYTPFGDRLPELEARIAAHRGAEAAARTGEPLASEVARQERLLRESRERAPHPLWSLVTTVAFALWLWLTWRGLRRSFDAEGRLVGRRALAWGGLSALALATWLLGLTLV
jgi:hypothetical protein